MLDKETAKELAARYADEVQKILSPTAVILFGSYANGVPHEFSDIDIAIIVHDYGGNWLETASMLHGLTRKVSINIEPHLMDETSDPSGFLAHVKKTGEVIFEAA